MTEEAAVLLRISVFGLVAGIVYWSVSYEPLGTVGFLLLGAGPGFAGLYLLAHQPRPAEPARDRLRRLAGVPAPDPRTEAELAEEDLGVLPSPSIWPFALALGATLAATGLVFGFWPLILGVGLGAIAAVGWQAAVNREQRQGRLVPPSRDDDDRPTASGGPR
jgi:cytochrome c oxidase subunit IV